MGISERTLRERMANIRCWKRGGERAPHKPLLLLLALARVQSHEPRTLRYLQVEGRLRSLLQEFGPPRRQVHPEHPFWRLRNDGLWEITDEASITTTSKGDAMVSSLREADPSAGFPEEVHNFLLERPALVNDLATQILDRNFPHSLHESILDAVGFPWVVEVDRKRDPGFRERILRIYENRCAFCGYEGRIGNSNVGLEAAHVKWHAAGGPDEDRNGLALCALHHVLFDRGAIGLDEGCNLLVSTHFSGREFAELAVLRLVGEQLRGPIPGESGPAPEFVYWHQQEVFREPRRQVVG